jgi:CRISPR system Cascade subunit CasE
VLHDLANPYQMHRTLMSAFPESLPAGERVLYRLEQRRSQPLLTVLVQSFSQPNWDRLGQQGYLLAPAAVKTFDFQAAVGQIFIFRLTANPTKRLKAEGKIDGPRVGLVREEDQLKWLQRKGESHGFSVLDARLTKLVQPDGWKQENGKKHCISCQAVRFDGRLQVTDPGMLAQAVTEGIGSGKGFGFGLLSLAPAG